VPNNEWYVTSVTNGELEFVKYLEQEFQLSPKFVSIEEINVDIKNSHRDNLLFKQYPKGKIPILLLSLRGNNILLYEYLRAKYGDIFNPEYNPYESRDVPKESTSSIIKKEQGNSNDIPKESTFSTTKREQKDPNDYKSYMQTWDKTNPNMEYFFDLITDGKSKVLDHIIDYNRFIAQEFLEAYLSIMKDNLQTKILRHIINNYNISSFYHILEGSGIINHNNNIFIGNLLKDLVFEDYIRIETIYLGWKYKGIPLSVLSTVINYMIMYEQFIVKFIKLAFKYKDLHLLFEIIKIQYLDLNLSYENFLDCLLVLIFDPNFNISSLMIYTMMFTKYTSRDVNETYNAVSQWMNDFYTQLNEKRGDVKISVASALKNFKYILYELIYGTLQGANKVEFLKLAYVNQNYKLMKLIEYRTSPEMLVDMIVQYDDVELFKFYSGLWLQKEEYGETNLHRSTISENMLENENPIEDDILEVVIETDAIKILKFLMKEFDMKLDSILMRKIYTPKSNNKIKTYLREEKGEGEFVEEFAEEFKHDEGEFVEDFQEEFQEDFPEDFQEQFQEDFPEDFQEEFQEEFPE